MCRSSFDVELLAGDPAAAAAFGEAGCRLFEELGELSRLSSAAGGSRKRSTRSIGSKRPTPGPTAAWSSAPATTSSTRCSGGKVLARRGQHAEAGRLAYEAVAIGEETDLLDAKGDTYADLAEVLVLSGKLDEAAAALEQALARYQRKGNLVSTQRVETRLVNSRTERSHERAGNLSRFDTHPPPRFPQLTRMNSTGEDLRDLLVRDQVAQAGSAGDSWRIYRSLYRRRDDMFWYSRARVNPDERAVTGGITTVVWSTKWFAKELTRFTPSELGAGGAAPGRRAPLELRRRGRTEEDLPFAREETGQHSNRFLRGAAFSPHTKTRPEHISRW